jgi:EAL domain-containing protein (putative c-di-GMP-specific phosphodiesterase class I)
MSVLAEGIETPYQLTLLAQLECDEIQGYLICTLMPAEWLTKAMRNKGIQIPNFPHLSSKTQK